MSKASNVSDKFKIRFKEFYEDEKLVRIEYNYLVRLSGNSKDKTECNFVREELSNLADNIKIKNKED